MQEYSDEELMQIAGMGQSTDQPSGQFDSIPDEELQAIANSKTLPKKIGGDTVIEEQHPDISFADRAIIKNLSQSPKASTMYLAKKYPNADVKLSKDGRILFKRPDEREYKVVDPKGFDIQDITDVGADIASGISEGGAGIIGAGIGAGAGGLGAIPGAMLASGAAGSANEYMRQRLGKALGIPQEVDTSDVAMSGGMSAISPLLFGAGGSIGKQLAKEGASEAASTLAERGLIGAGFRKGTAKAGELFTGTNKKVFERATDPKAAENLDGIANQGEEIFANDKLTELDSAILQRHKEVGKEIGEKLRMSGKQIDISEAKKRITDQITALQNKQGAKGLSSSDAAKLEELKSVYDDAFTRIGADGNKVELGNLIDAEEAFDVKDILAQNADFLKTPNKGSTLAESKKATYLKSVSKNASGAYGSIKDSIEKSIADAADLNKKFRESLEDIDYFSSKFRNKKSMGPDDLPSGEAFTEKGYKLLRQVGYENPNKKDIAKKIARLDEKYGTNVLESSKDLAASDFKKNASLAQVSGLGTTSTSRTLQGQALGGGLGAYLGSQFDTEGGRPLGGMLGVGLGAFMTSPKAFKTFLNMQTKLGTPMEIKVPGLKEKINLGTPMDPRTQQVILNMMQNSKGE